LNVHIGIWTWYWWSWIGIVGIRTWRIRTWNGKRSRCWLREWSWWIWRRRRRRVIIVVLSFLVLVVVSTSDQRFRIHKNDFAFHNLHGNVPLGIFSAVKEWFHGQHGNLLSSLVMFDNITLEVFSIASMGKFVASPWMK
jgi:hypothetical protein